MEKPHHHRRWERKKDFCGEIKPDEIEGSKNVNRNLYIAPLFGGNMIKISNSKAFP
jgi:hypothetical protein